MTRLSTRLLTAAAVAGAFALGLEANALAGQPHMQLALEHLQAARAELIAATPDKGGHRALALQAVEQAIDHTRMGIRFDRRH